MDRISNLPDEIICHIVSFLSAKEAAFALVLSKRWLNLFTITPRLRFKDWSKKVQGSLIDFLNGVIALPLSSRIKEVSLRCRERVDSVLINRFLFVNLK
ncbi:F-box/LRR-repeat protein [Cardamine amara subsp. amara]|uniref:F-box/LRR-repeat protein n=1 Tax=Cardamine amara subsp. amara TaxID=228776 RepID=A0ABD0ZT08_CARAN